MLHVRLYLTVAYFTRLLSPRSPVGFEFQFKDASLAAYTLFPDFNRRELKRKETALLRVDTFSTILENLSNEDGNGNKNATKQKV